MAKGDGGVRHGLGPFDPGGPTSRKNSASIRRFLYDLIIYGFNRSPAKAAEGLTKALNEAEDQRAYRRGFSENTTYNVLSDRKTISFNELDSLGLYYNVPIALVLLFTQLRSEMTNFGKARAQHTLEAFLQSATVLRRALANPDAKGDGYQVLPHEVFLEAQEAFGGIQPNLPMD